MAPVISLWSLEDNTAHNPAQVTTPINAPVEQGEAQEINRARSLVIGEHVCVPAKIGHMRCGPHGRGWPTSYHRPGQPRAALREPTERPQQASPNPPLIAVTRITGYSDMGHRPTSARLSVRR